MQIPSDINELAKIFEKFGAHNAQAWAQSQIKERRPQLQRYLFLRQAWKKILGDDDDKWIDRQIKESDQNPNGPYASIGLALKRSVRNGADRLDLIDIARGAQAELLFQLCYLLDDPGFVEPELETFAWGLFQVDENDMPIAPRIGGLHESVLDTDPTGREMRPRNARDM
jgi:hypothetical protein